MKKLTPTERLAKIAAIVERAGDRTGKYNAILLTEAELLGIYLLAVATPDQFDVDRLSDVSSRARGA